jgi:hypothetical protein
MRDDHDAALRSMRRLVAAAILAASLPMPAAWAADPAPAAAPGPLPDPWVPPDARKPPASAPTQGAALREQVERKLRQRFDAADVNGTGAITRAQASAAGLGFVVQHFNEIDAQRTGFVRFEDVKRYLRGHGAQLN